MKRRPTISVKCPAYVPEKDDVCGELIEIDAWPSEPMTHWYPGSPAGFEVVEAGCGHADLVMDNYRDEIFQVLADRELAAQEAAAEAEAERLAEKVYDYDRDFDDWHSYGGEG